MVPQAALFAPGDSARKVEKALQSEAGTVILDLEDGVAAANKALARETVAAALRQSATEKRILLRLNAPETPFFADDLEWARGVPADGIVLPKCERPDDVEAVARAVPEREIVPLIETALGVLNFEAIAGCNSRVRQAAFGSVDFALDLGVEWTAEGLERQYAMGVLALVSRALRLEPPIDAVFPLLDDSAAFERDARVGRSLGFGSKMVIHPRQVEWLRGVHTPSPAHVAWCRRAVAAYESAGCRGSLQVEGRLVDLPVYKQARQILASCLI